VGGVSSPQSADRAPPPQAEEAKQLNTERMHAARECKASSVLNKFKDMEKRIANGEDLDEDKREFH
jgi:hypothetical protein